MQINHKIASFSHTIWQVIMLAPIQKIEIYIYIYTVFHLCVCAG